MSESEEFPIQDLKATEAALAALAPTPAALDRDRLMFQAGRAARPGPSWGWPAATGILAAVAATLALVMVTRPPVVTETVVIRVSVEPTPAPIPLKTEPETPADSPIVAFRPVEVETGSLASPGYLQLQEQILRWGLDALPSGPPTTLAKPPLTVEKLLGESPKRPDNSPWWKLEKFIPIGGQS